MASDTVSEQQLAPEGEPARTGRELILASRPYAEERRLESWWHFGSGMLLLFASAVLAALVQPWPLRLLASLLSALMILRVFILYHDFMHRALLRGSPVAKFFMHVYGLLILAPPRVWKRSHDYHHAHTAKFAGSQVGSFPTLTTGMWERMSTKRRLMYRIARHPFTMVFGYFTVFLWGMGIGALLTNPRKSWDAGLSLLVHFGTLFGLAYFFGVDVMFFGFWLPLAISCAIGSYLFYAQHNFPGIQLRSRHDWAYTDAALNASSYMKLNPIMQWFSGNIGYHHVHHLNSSIPFYRLPEAMDELPELQSPVQTSLGARDILACLRVKLWDKGEQRMVGYREANR